MRPKSEPKQVERELFQSELEQIIDLRHPLVKLGTSIDWASLERIHPSKATLFTELIAC